MCNVKMINELNNISHDSYRHELKISESTVDTFNKIKDVFSPFYEF